ncbi:MAG TPA: hypothetical protein VN613_00080 [Gemmatimonadaceae bacterium]|nr:hypothetical protein [Gemmatimonadaceae bacterium]
MRAPAPERVSRAPARRAFRALARLAAIAAAAPALHAQFAPVRPTVQLGVRADLLGGPPAGAQIGVGANVPAGYYVRLGVDAAGGAAVRDGSTFASGRVDVVARYLLDPYAEFRWGPYVGGGVTAQWDRRATRRADLLLLVGIEGPAHAGWRTAVELGLGGGARLGVVLRRARSNAR